jgi:peptide/nickel transport system substrate-binding protein
MCTPKVLRAPAGTGGEAMRGPPERVDAIRARSTDRENHLIDELRAGKIGRREFVRRAAVAGMSIPLAGFIATACGAARDPLEEADPPQTGVPKQGGTLRVGQQQPPGALDPVIVNNQPGLTVLGQTGEFLVWSDGNLELQPRLAESWSANDDGSAWTFNLRQGVKFHNGAPMEAEDVVTTFDRLADPENGSNALSVFTGVLSKGGAKAVDASTVEFTLDAPTGNFPYLTSSDNYNAIILPKDYEGDWEKTFIGTGPWKLGQYRPGVGITLLPNEQYWDPTRRPLAEKCEFVFFTNEQSLILGFQGNQVDVVVQFSVSGGKALLTDPTVVTTELKSSAHRQCHMRCDVEPFDDKRIRQAVGLLVNRPNLVDGLLDTKTDIGNDSPFAPVYPSTSPDVRQREQNVAEARKLLEAAGVADGFSVTLSTWDGFEMPDYAQLLQQDLRAANIRLNLSITDDGTYYGDATFGNSPWLDSKVGITEYGHRGVPNVLLGAPLLSTGTWNSAHFKNPTYDQLFADYTAAIDLDVQRATAQQIQELLLDETPILFAYFYYFLSGAKDYVAGVETTAMGHTDVSRTGFI